MNPVQPIVYRNAALHNVAEIQPVEGGVRLSRIPFDLHPFVNETARARALRGACSELRFNLRGDLATVTLQTDDEPGIIEVYNGPFLQSWHIVQPRPTTIAISAPERQTYVHHASLRQHLAFDPMLYRVILPWKQVVLINDIAGEIAPPRPGQTPAVRYLAYGSSITNGSMSIGPTGMWAMRTAQNLGVDLINLGFGGAAHCEPELADYIAARTDWHFATLELGINMVNWASVEEFASRAAYFVKAIVRAHPDRWVFCLDMFPFWRDLDPDDTRPLEYREAVRHIVSEINSPQVVHIEARSLLPDWSGLTSDILHPGPAGMEMIAGHLTPIIRQHLGDSLHL